jgi:hypothetical protein
MKAHEHVWTVIGFNDQLREFAFLKSKDKQGRPYFWRVSECQLPDCPSAASGGALFTEGAFDPFPAVPAIGESLRDLEPVQGALL